MEREKRYLAHKQYNPSRVIRFGTTMHNCLTYNVLKSRQWQETQVDDWDIFYADTGWIHENLPYSGFASGGLRLNEWQKVSMQAKRLGSCLALCCVFNNTGKSRIPRCGLLTY